jgi:amidase
MGVLGPLARSAADLQLALDVISGPEPGEEKWTVTLPPARGRTLEDLKVAMLPPLDAAPIDDCVGTAMDLVAETIARAGASPEVVGPDLDWPAMIETYRTLLAIMVFDQLTPEARDKLASDLEAAGDEFERGTIAGLRLAALDFADVLIQREHVRRAWAAFFDDWDVVVAPITLGPPFEHTDAPWSERSIVVNGQHIPYGRQVVPAAVATLPGLPATAFPVTRTTVNGVELPIGLQVIGPYLEDRTPIRFAALVERELGGFVPPPGYEHVGH